MKRLLWDSIVTLSLFMTGSIVFPVLVGAELQRAQIIRFLGVGVTHDVRDVRQGAVGELVVGWEERTDRHGIIVSFLEGPGSFSPDTELAILGAIDRAARAAGLNTESWNVSLTVHEPAGTIFGDSLTGMVALTVVALANGDFIPLDRTMTGTITADGGIGPVSSLPLKIEAAYRNHLRRVIVPDTLDITDSDWFTPFLMHISPIHSAAVAYQALTDHSFVPARIDSSASLAAPFSP
jgi:Lon protease (S16) C-terminal proteolytic domain